MRAAAELVRQGAVFADIGTDHALLPVFLCKTGRISRAVAADINEGPLAAAKKQVREAGLTDKIRLHLADGLSGLENEGLTDIAICGMGGELIVSILENAPFVKNPGIRLILQPMTHAADLRRYLAENGFEVVAERTAEAAGKCYFCLAAEYTGVPYDITRLEATLGSLSHRDLDDAFSLLVEKEIRAAEKRCKGLCEKGTPNPEEEEYLASLYELNKELAK